MFDGSDLEDQSSERDKRTAAGGNLESYVEHQEIIFEAAREASLCLQLLAEKEQESASKGKEFLGCIDLPMVTEPLFRIDQTQIKPGYWYQKGDGVNHGKLASEFLCAPREVRRLIAGRPREKLPPSPKPCAEMLDYQKTLLSAYFFGVGEEGASVPFKLNKVGGFSKDWRDCAILTEFCLKHHCSSESSGNDLLKMIRKLCENHDIVLPLHKDWRSLQRAVEKNLRELHTIYRVVWTLPPHIFGIVDMHDHPLQPVTAASYDILKTIAFKFLKSLLCSREGH